MGGVEKDLKGTRGERCWERRTRREEMMGSLLKASIMSGIMKGRDENTKLYLSLKVIYTSKDVLNQLSLEQMNMVRYEWKKLVLKGQYNTITEIRMFTALSEPAAYHLLDVPT